MINNATRRPQVDEEGALRHIWKTVFDDGGESGFFDYYFDPELCVVVDCGDYPVAAGYILPSGNIVCGELSVPCAMIYGVATLPEYRKLGFGAAVVNELISTARYAGFPATTLCPSDDSLFAYYSARSEFRDLFYISERKLRSIPAIGATPGLVAIPPCDYSRIRESLLQAIPHIEPDLRALSYQESLCRESGGGLFMAGTSGGASCAVVERQQDGALWIKELLAPEGYEADVIAGIAKMFPAIEYVARTPAKSGNIQQSVHNTHPDGRTTRENEQSVGSRLNYWDDTTFATRRFGMLVAPEPLLCAISKHKNQPWFGIAFD